ARCQRRGRHLAPLTLARRRLGEVAQVDARATAAPELELVRLAGAEGLPRHDRCVVRAVRLVVVEPGAARDRCVGALRRDALERLLDNRTRGLGRRLRVVATLL